MIFYYLEGSGSEHIIGTIYWHISAYQCLVSSLSIRIKAEDIYIYKYIKDIYVYSALSAGLQRGVWQT